MKCSVCDKEAVYYKSTIWFTETRQAFCEECALRLIEATTNNIVCKHCMKQIDNNKIVIVDNTIFCCSECALKECGFNRI